MPLTPWKERFALAAPMGRAGKPVACQYLALLEQRYAYKLHMRALASAKPVIIVRPFEPPRRLRIYHERRKRLIEQARVGFEEDHDWLDQMYPEDATSKRPPHSAPGYVPPPSKVDSTPAITLEDEDRGDAKVRVDAEPSPPADGGSARSKASEASVRSKAGSQASTHSKAGGDASARSKGGESSARSKAADESGEGAGDTGAPGAPDTTLGEAGRDGRLDYLAQQVADSME